MVRKCRICGHVPASVTTFFGAPKRDEAFRRWFEAVHANTGIELRERDLLCERHFDEGEIKDCVTIRTAEGNILYERKLVKKVLDKTAVPSKFVLERTTGVVEEQEENIEVESCLMEEEVITEHEIHEQCSIPSTSSGEITEIKDHDYATSFRYKIDSPNNPIIRDDINLNDHTDLNDFQIIEEIPKENSDVLEFVETENVQSAFSIDTVISEIEKLIPANGNWRYSVQLFPMKLIVEEIDISKDQKPWCKKQIVINENLGLEVYLIGKPFLYSPKLFSMENVQLCFDRVDGIRMCDGVEFSDDENLKLKCAYKDYSGKWRHQLCTLEVNNENVCKYCKNLNFCYIIRKSCHGYFKIREQKEQT